MKENKFVRKAFERGGFGVLEENGMDVVNSPEGCFLQKSLTATGLNGYIGWVHLGGGLPVPTSVRISCLMNGRHTVWMLSAFGS